MAFISGFMILMIIGFITILFIPFAIYGYHKSNKARDKAYAILKDNLSVTPQEIRQIIGLLQFDKNDIEKQELVKKLITKL